MTPPLAGSPPTATGPTRACTLCAAPLTGSPHRRYCSSACRHRARRLRRRAAAGLPSNTGACRRCGAPIAGPINRLYCRASCKTLASRARRGSPLQQRRARAEAYIAALRAEMLRS